MSDYPESATPQNHVAPVPRRVRAVLGGRTVIDTTSALYVWEWPAFPQYYIPMSDVDAGVLVDEQHEEHRPQGTANRYSIQMGDDLRTRAARHFTQSDLPGVAGKVRFQWDAFDSWFEEDEEVFVHPRNPYSRVDALPSTRTVVVELDGLELARSSSTVMVFETGLPTRYYFHRTEVHFEHLEHTDTETACPYKGVTSDYWSVRSGDVLVPDLAWAYNFPTRELLPIAGLVAFYNEKVDIVVDGERLERPETHFS